MRFLEKLLTGTTGTIFTQDWEKSLIFREISREFCRELPRLYRFRSPLQLIRRSHPYMHERPIQKRFSVRCTACRSLRLAPHASRFYSRLVQALFALGPSKHLPATVDDTRRAPPRYCEDRKGLRPYCSGHLHDMPIPPPPPPKHTKVTYETHVYLPALAEPGWSSPWAPLRTVARPVIASEHGASEVSSWTFRVL